MSDSNNEIDYLHKEFPKKFKKHEFWAQIKRTVNGKPVSEEDIKMIVDQIKSCLSLEADSHLLDIGCGNGALAGRLFPFIKEYTGVDFSSYLLEIANEYFRPNCSINYIEKDALAFVSEYENSQVFNKLLVYGCMSYLSRADFSVFLDKVYSRFSNVDTVFIGNIPDINKARQFFKNGNINSYDVDNEKSAIGVWWDAGELKRLASEAGFSVEIYKMPTNFYGHHYRFDMVLRRKLNANESSLGRLGGTGLFSNPISTSNLYLPQKNKVSHYLDLPENPKELFNRLETSLCEYHDSKYCVLFSTGFWALVAAIKLKSLPGKMQVIIPSLTYRRLADVVYWAGLVPVFVDIDPDSLAVSPSEISSHINENTGLILAVHPIVNCCDVTAIIEIANLNQVPVIFDAVESVHETHKGKRIGSFGVGEVFSLHASKLINGLEGGYVCTNDMVYALALNDFKCGNLSTYKNQSYVGLNGLPHVGHAAFALACLDEIESNIDHNRKIYYRYVKRLADIRGIRLLKFDEVEQTSYKNIVVEITAEFSVSRDELVQILNAEKILARKYYYPALHNKNYDYPVITGRVENCDYAENCYMNLPCGSRVSEKDVDLLCEFIGFINENREILL
jgi:dTDP-4-amino-4,6-dideoxygalactose transaminase/cyclopropane fatty-acyl-phospholipid synthase-like methyltransferase